MGQQHQTPTNDSNNQQDQNDQQSQGQKQGRGNQFVQDQLKVNEMKSQARTNSSNWYSETLNFIDTDGF